MLYHSSLPTILYPLRDKDVARLTDSNLMLFAIWYYLLPFRLLYYILLVLSLVSLFVSLKRFQKRER